jgi:hypothetical protein
MPELKHVLVVDDNESESRLVAISCNESQNSS